MLYLVTLYLAIDSLWTFLMLRYYQLVLGDNSPDPKGPLTTLIPRQATAEASKQVHATTIAKASKRRGNGRFNAKTSTWTGKYSCENDSSHCQAWIEGNQVSSEALPFCVGCTAWKHFQANIISCVRVTASSTKFITHENFYVYRNHLPLLGTCSTSQM